MTDSLAALNFGGKREAVWLAEDRERMEEVKTHRAI
jgi:hypothetical protein